MSENKVLATVNGKEITEKDLDFYLNSFDPQAAARLRTPEGRKSLLQELVNQELVYLHAKEKGMDEEAEYKLELEKIKTGFLKEYALRKLLDSVKINDEEALAFYNQNISLFASSASVKASHILVDNLTDADRIHAEIMGGLSFESAAEKYSEIGRAHV